MVHVGDLRHVGLGKELQRLFDSSKKKVWPREALLVTESQGEVTYLRRVLRRGFKGWTGDAH